MRKKIKKSEKNWYIIDAKGKILGRLATQLALRLKGKHKPEYTPHMDNGDYMIVINAEKISITGKKYINKIYYHHTGFIGGIKSVSFKEMLEKNPEKIIFNAVKGMLPKGPLGRAMCRKLKVYVGNIHKHMAQNPSFLEI
ncbi:50S ribosomal protein L13 [Candidatus Schneideria nysicola]|uniref:50S ribosomal protein L13 n=1 Tax=Candidatus Schneideria nysicola TaxID=1081631 RepID=UPI001CAA7D56|nr:50S ribosomal protein L13 [Candidatus Schneideria nysicola]UAJ65778.1 50S ribosomal protein L13 [Candidatus Schneideria nysicola]